MFDELQVKWRPQRREHIGSSALVVDFAINVWDIRKPYLPFAAFESHRDVATGIVWRGNPHVLLSTSKVSIFSCIAYDLIKVANKLKAKKLKNCFLFTN
jgi:hypothetical protein